MNHPMRRGKQELAAAEARELLKAGTEGVLSLTDPEGFPYGVPINYVLDGNTLYFHCAKAGRKLDCIAVNPYASFCLIAAADIVPEEFTTYFRSVIVSGPICIVEDEQVKLDALRKLGLKFYDNLEACDKEIAAAGKRCHILALTVEEISGKEAIELTRARG